MHRHLSKTSFPLVPCALSIRMAHYTGPKLLSPSPEGRKGLCPTLCTRILSHRTETEGVARSPVSTAETTPDHRRRSPHCRASCCASRGKDALRGALEALHFFGWIEPPGVVQALRPWKATRSY